MVAAFLVLPCRNAPAQVPSPATTAESNWLLLPVLAGFSAVLLAAPPSLVLFVDSTPRSGIESLGHWDNHVTAYLAGGYVDAMRREDRVSGWGHSGSLEVFTRGVYAEVRVENFRLPSLVQFQTVRVGYLLHAPHRSAAGGVTIGYRRAYGDRVQPAWEIGLPAVLALTRPDRRADVVWRFEPTYLISSEGVSWNYRWQTDFHIRGTAVIPGIAFEAKPMRQDGPYFVAVSLVLGVRM